MPNVRRLGVSPPCSQCNWVEEFCFQAMQSRKQQFRGVTAVRLSCVSLLLGMLIATASCGGGTSTVAHSQPLSGNWQMSLAVSPQSTLTFTGFLLQSGKSVTGSFILGSDCPGVGSVTGTVEGQNVTLAVNQFGNNVSFAGSMPSSNAPITGSFSNLSAGCAFDPDSGAWTASPVAPLTGSFHGTFTSAASIGNGTLNVTGNLAQGPNTGSSTAPLTGTIATPDSNHFCSYLSTATINGLISGTTVMLRLYGPDGSQIAQIGNLGSQNPSSLVLTATPNGTSLSGTYIFPAISSSCSQDSGTFQVTFP